VNRILLDTNVWLWMALDDEHLGPSTRRLIYLAPDQS
jgi:PIN domain nuclease of toxin-antitoxin system